MSVVSATAGLPCDIRFERLACRLRPETARRFAIALVAVFICFAPYLANLSRDYTRYCYLWRRSDALVLGGLMIVLALGCLGVERMMRRRGRRMLEHCFLAVVGIGLLANLGFLGQRYAGLQTTGPSMQAGWVILALIIGYSFGHPGCRLPHWCGQLCLMATPVVPLVFAKLLTASTYPDGLEPISPQALMPCEQKGEARRGGIYVFLFDEWSFERTFTGGKPLPQYSNLAAFARTATSYTDAHAPGEKTEDSIPAILLQTGDRVVVDNGRLGFERPDRSLSAARQYTSVFDRMDPLGYRSVLTGFTLPYRSWLGSHVDVVRTYCYYPRADALPVRAGIHLLNAWRYVPDLWGARRYKRLEGRIMHAATREIIQNVREDVHTVARQWPANTFLFAHVHMPHMPALMNADLTFRDADHTGWQDGDLASYERNLAAMDAMVGDFLGALREAGKYDDAVIVLTSDHTWRCDPNWAAGRLHGPRTHVPLLVKAPMQTTGTVVTHRFETKDLGVLIEGLAAGNPGASAVAENHKP